MPAAKTKNTAVKSPTLRFLHRLVKFSFGALKKQVKKSKKDMYWIN